ncbi:hypothetical protein [Sinorhizobium fredii]|nr:hypothetical protein [Sinorhizobium fredii]
MLGANQFGHRELLV